MCLKVVCIPGCPVQTILEKFWSGGDSSSWLGPRQLSGSLYGPHFILDQGNCYYKECRVKTPNMEQIGDLGEFLVFLFP